MRIQLIFFSLKLNVEKEVENKTFNRNKNCHYNQHQSSAVRKVRPITPQFKGATDTYGSLKRFYH